MTEIELRKKVCACARSWLGRREADGSFRPIIDIYNSITPLPGGYRMTYTDPWCAAFVSAVGQACGLTDVILPECSCDRMIDLYRARGRWVEDDGYSPQMGDIIMYDWQDSGYGDNTGSADHVGLVVDANGREITVIEGNKSDMVAYRSIRQDGQFVRGYCLPDYAAAAAEDPPQETADEPQGVIVITDPVSSPDTSETCTVTLPVLREDMESETVRRAQRLLIAEGLACGGPYSAVYRTELPDGEFGLATKTAVQTIQTRAGLPQTGILDGPTWTVLLTK